MSLRIDPEPTDELHFEITDRAIESLASGHTRYVDLLIRADRGVGFAEHSYEVVVQTDHAAHRQTFRVVLSPSRGVFFAGASVFVTLLVILYIVIFLRMENS